MIEPVKGLMANAVRPRVLHSLPGRVRFHLPALQHANTLIDARRIEAFLEVCPGLTAVEASPLSGNVLIRYNPALITEQQLIAGITKITSALARDYSRMEQLVRLPTEEIAARARRFLEEHYREVFLEKRDLEIPDYVWN